MPNLHSSKSGQGRQAPATTPMSTTKAKKGRPVKNKVANATKVNNVTHHVPNTAGDTDVSTATLPSPLYLSGFGSLSENPYPLSGYSAQAARLHEHITTPKNFSGD